jgi:hypothetical protein
VNSRSHMRITGSKRAKYDDLDAGTIGPDTFHSFRPAHSLSFVGAMRRERSSNLRSRKNDLSGGLLNPLPKNRESSTKCILVAGVARRVYANDFVDLVFENLD